MLVVVWLVLVFVLGAAVGSFLNVCIARLPLEKSLFWPGSRCGSCFQRIRWYDNIPLVSYWVLRGRCRTCQARFSARYFLVELLTAGCFVGLFYLEVIANVHHFQVLEARRFFIERGVIPYQGWVVFGFHAALLSFLLIVVFCDLDRREIPMSVTVFGTVVGLIGAMLWPWPWPYTPEQAAITGPAADREWWMLNPLMGPRQGLYPWPVWGPLPEGLAPGGNWQTGLATGLAGMMVGTLLLRTVRFLFSKGLGKEALGLGDADLMMMAGSFLGWQPVVIAFFLSVIPALVFGIVQLVITRDNSLPFGPSLALGVVMTWLGWYWIGPRVQVLFFHGKFLLILLGACCVFMLVSSYLIRMVRLARG